VDTILRGDELIVADIPQDSPAGIWRAPTNSAALIFAVKMLARLLLRKYRSLFRCERWNIGVVNAPIHSFLDKDFRPQISYLPESGGRNRFVADPFGINRGSKLTILCEEFDYRDAKGSISAVDLQGDGRAPSLRRICNKPFHLSYPYLFEHGGDIYCVPEMAQARRIDLFKALSFPDKWVKIGEIMTSVPAVDPTIFKHGGLWWLLFAGPEAEASLNLYAWYSPELLGPWRSHRRNPVKTDVRSARPAGAPFVHEGSLYRPAQDCATSYGRRVILCRVKRLTPYEFDEEPVAAVEPDPSGPYPDGLHTLSAAGELTLVDGVRRVFIPTAFRRRLVGWARKRPRPDFA
jgi:hypothetical protein